MTTTVRLLSTYNGNAPQTIVRLDDALAASFVAAGNASLDLTGGINKPPTATVHMQRGAAQLIYNAAGTFLGLGDTQGNLLVTPAGLTVPNALGKPGAPTAFTLTAAAGAVVAAFTAPADLGGDPSTVRYILALSNGTKVEGGSSPLSASAPAGIAVTGSVTAISSLGESAASATASATPTGPAVASALTHSLSASTGNVGDIRVLTVKASPTGGAITGTLTITPTPVTGLTISPASQTMTTGVDVQFNVTATAAGAYAINIANNGGLTNPTAVGYVASAVSSTVRLVATLGEVNLLGAAANTTSKLRATGRSAFRTSKAKTMSIGVVLQNFFLTTARLETDIANGVAVRAHIEIPGAPTPVVVLTWGGLSSGAMPAGSAKFPSDLALCTAFGYPNGIPEGMDGFVVVQGDVALNELMAFSVGPQATGEGSTYGSGATSAIGVAGALVNQEGGATGAMFMPQAIIGTTNTPVPSVVLFGDSLTFGFKDGGTSAVGGGNGNGGGGMFARAAFDIGSGKAMPALRQARTGTTAAQGAANYTKQSALWTYATHGMCALVSNDVNAGTAAATIMTNLGTIHAAMTAAGLWTEQMKCMARASTTTDAWATVAGETVATSFTTAGIKGQINTLIANAVTAGANGLKNFLDNDPAWAAPTPDQDKVNAPGYTDDGTHLLPFAAPLVAAATIVPRFNSWVAPA